MILKDLKKTRKYLIVVDRFNIFIFLAIIFVASACQKKSVQSEKKLAAESEFIIGENPAYQKVGKLKLSEYGFFNGPLANLSPTERVFLYDIKSALFSDYALKKRFIYLPEGTKLEKNEEGDLEFPTGAILIKIFYYEDTQLKHPKGRIIETRLLIREENGWKALPYIWNMAQTEAYLEIAGGNFTFQLAGHAEPFTYSVPTMTQCKSCHEKNGAIEPIGPSLRQINRQVEMDDGEKNQLTLLHEKGWTETDWSKDQIDDFANYSEANYAIEDRARAYLDVNCAHCHRPEGPAKNSGLNLSYNNSDTYSLGLNKPPVAAGKGSGGLLFDIVKGKPEESILYYRMESTDPGIMMPELGHHMVHQEGLEVIREWIAGMR